VGIGAAALLATWTARWTVTRLQAAALTRALSALLGAFGVYEAVLLAVAVSGLGGAESFTLGIVTRILAFNAVAFAGLYGLYRLGAVMGLSGAPVAISASVARPAS
jgi:hypothetical protein